MPTHSGTLSYQHVYSEPQTKTHPGVIYTHPGGEFTNLSTHPGGEFTDLKITSNPQNIVSPQGDLSHTQGVNLLTFRPRVVLGVTLMTGRLAGSREHARTNASGNLS